MTGYSRGDPSKEVHMFQPSALNHSLAHARTDDITRVARRVRRVRPGRRTVR